MVLIVLGKRGGPMRSERGLDQIPVYRFAILDPAHLLNNCRGGGVLVCVFVGVISLNP